MLVNGKQYQAVWMEKEVLCMIDQRYLPFRFKILKSKSLQSSCEAIANMSVRGAGTIGATAGFAMVQAFAEVAHRDIDGPQHFLARAKRQIEHTRPTARDLFYAVDRVYNAGIEIFIKDSARAAYQVAFQVAHQIAEAYIENAREIGVAGSSLLQGKRNILTHCNAGWLALVDHGSALSPVFQAHANGQELHVWVDETRPRSQGARLTAWELQQAGISHCIIADNAAGLLMARGDVDVVITGADRIASNGDVANKIGTLEKAILASAFYIPFYVAAPTSTFDPSCASGDDIIIEERPQEEVQYISGLDRRGRLTEILHTNPGSPAYNPAFDVTPGKLVSTFISERGIHPSAPWHMNNSCAT